MASVSQCQNDIRRYTILRNNVISIISQLSQTIRDTDDLSNGIKSKYQINDNYTPTVSRAIQLKSNMESTCNYLNNKVIPAIDRAIDNLNNDILKLRNEEKQRKKTEQEKRQQKNKNRKKI